MIALTIGAEPLEVLLLGAHPDDIEIGCGGTLLELGDRGTTTGTFVVMTGSGGRRAEARKAAESFLPGSEVWLGEYPDGRLPQHWGEVKTALEGIAGRLHPDIVFSPSRDDSHQDHRLLGELAPTVWRDALILEYEIPKWDGDLRALNHYVAVGTANAERKVELLNEVFASQLDRDWWSNDTFLAMMRLRGIECRSGYAEAFLARKAKLDLRIGMA